MPPTFGVGLSTSVKAIPKVRLPTQMIPICGKLALRPPVTAEEVSAKDKATHVDYPLPEMVKTRSVPDFRFLTVFMYER